MIKLVDRFILNNDIISLTIVPEIGDIIKSIKYLPENFEYLYNHYRPLKKYYEIAGGSYNEDLLNSMFSGGYFDAVPNAGYKCSVNNTTFGLHDETPYIPWDVKEHHEEYISTFTYLYKYPLKIEKDIELKHNKILIKESIENISGEKLPYSWLHHPTFGSNLLSGETIINISDSNIISDSSLGNLNARFKRGYEGKWPFVLDNNGSKVDISKFPDKGKYNTNDLLYLTEVKKPEFSIENNKRKIIFRYDNNLFKCLWLWLPTGGGPGYPWFGTIYAMAIEMSTSFPASGLYGQINNKTANYIEPYDKISTLIEIEIL